MGLSKQNLYYHLVSFPVRFFTFKRILDMVEKMDIRVSSLLVMRLILGNACNCQWQLLAILMLLPAKTFSVIIIANEYLELVTMRQSIYNETRITAKYVQSSS